MKKQFLALLAMIVIEAPVGADSLYGLSLNGVLERQFPDARISYLLLDPRCGSVLSARWEGFDQPSPLGSLVKPFTALAYGELHGYQYFEYECKGELNGCWLPAGHGRVGIVEAIGYSCNAYFRALADGVPAQVVSMVARRYGLTPVDESRAPAAPATLIGVGGGWRVPPLNMALAYCELMRRAGEPGNALILRGLFMSARVGTGRGCSVRLPAASVYAKTGTGPCIHKMRAMGDGYAIAIYPADSPRLTLMVRVHGVPGARAAVVAGEMLRSILGVA